MKRRYSRPLSGSACANAVLGCAGRGLETVARQTHLDSRDALDAWQMENIYETDYYKTK